MIWTLLWAFFKIGLVSFGGGYAIIPVIEHEALLRHWMDAEEFIRGLTIAGMAPGPVSTNSAAFIGYFLSGWPGGAYATLGMIIPSFLVIVLLGTFLQRHDGHKLIKGAFYGLRPVVTAMIAYAAFTTGQQFVEAEPFRLWRIGGAIVLFAAALLALTRFRIHPAIVLGMAGVAGAVVFA
ncbi:MAG TPA: chromate transporter [Bacilli bacterium]